MSDNTLEDLRNHIEHLTGNRPHHATGEAKLRQMIADLENGDVPASEPESKQSAQETPHRKVPLIPVVVRRDFWDEKEVRQPAGTIIEVPVEEAMDGVERGHFSRVR